MGRLRRYYGAHPLHLLVILAGLALTGYVVWLVSGVGPFPWMLVWFACALVGHDLVLFPLYALLDRAARLPGLRGAVNYVRVPALASGLLFLLFLPGIIEQGKGTYLAATGQTQDPYLGRWLLLTVILFALSELAFAARMLRNYLRSRKSHP